MIVNIVVRLTNQNCILISIIFYIKLTVNLSQLFHDKSDKWDHTVQSNTATAFTLYSIYIICCMDQGYSMPHKQIPEFSDPAIQW